MSTPYMAFEYYHNMTLNNNNNNFTVAETTWSTDSDAVGFPLLNFSCLEADVLSKQVM